MIFYLLWMLVLKTAIKSNFEKNQNCVITDTDCNPNIVDFAIPSNEDNVKAVI